MTDLGYSKFIEAVEKPYLDEGFVVARVIEEHRGQYVVKNNLAEFSATVIGKLMFYSSSREDYPAVGDWVIIKPVNNNQATIHQIMPRKTLLKRKSSGQTDTQIIASNIDIAFIVESPDRDYNLNRFERYLALVSSGNIKPVIVLNKIDLLSAKELELKLNELKKRFNDIEILPISTIFGIGITDLINSFLCGYTYCFIGSSGVGKSSIINVCMGKNLIATGEISSTRQRGRHITTTRSLYILDSGGILIDNPGMREIGLVDAKTGITDVFSQIKELASKCRFSNCIHIHEPGCAILEAVRAGELEKEKYDNYIKLVKENEFNTITKLEKREKDHKFGKFIKQAKKQMKKYK